MHKSKLGRSDSLSKKQAAFGRLFLTLFLAIPEPFIAFGLASLATVMLANIESV